MSNKNLVVIRVTTSDGTAESIETSEEAAKEFIDAWTEETSASRILIRGDALHSDCNAVELWFDKNFIVSIYLMEVKR